MRPARAAAAQRARPRLLRWPPRAPAARRARACSSVETPCQHSQRETRLQPFTAQDVHDRGWRRWPARRSSVMHTAGAVAARLRGMLLARECSAEPAGRRAQERTSWQQEAGFGVSTGTRLQMRPRIAHAPTPPAPAAAARPPPRASLQSPRTAARLAGAVLRARPPLGDAPALPEVL